MKVRSGHLRRPMAALLVAIIAHGAAAQQSADSGTEAIPSAPDVTSALVPPASQLRTIGKHRGARTGQSASLSPSSSDEAAVDDVAQSGSGLLGAIDPRGNDLTRVLGALAAVVGLILLARMLAVRFMPSLFRGSADRPSGVIEILARYPLGRGQQMIVLKFAHRILLVHQTGAAARTLAEITDSDEVASTLSRLETGASARSAAKFKAALQAFSREHETAMAQRNRGATARPAAEAEIIDLTRTRIFGGEARAGSRRVLR